MVLYPTPSLVYISYIIWTTLANNQIGASLQHYNPLVDNEIKREFNINDSWLLVAQMPFGGIKIVEKLKLNNFLKEEKISI